jgi:hypothetical protein
MSLGLVALADGGPPLGLQCAPIAAASGRDITEYDSWTAYLASPG